MKKQNKNDVKKMSNPKKSSNKILSKMIHEVKKDEYLYSYYYCFRQEHQPKLTFAEFINDNHLGLKNYIAQNVSLINKIYPSNGIHFDGEVYLVSALEFMTTFTYALDRGLPDDFSFENSCKIWLPAKY